MYQIVIVDKFYYLLPIGLKIIIVTKMKTIYFLFFILTKCLNCKQKQIINTL